VASNELMFQLTNYEKGTTIVSTALLPSIFAHFCKNSRSSACVFFSENEQKQIGEEQFSTTV